MRTQSNSQVVVIGASLAGLTTAIGLASAGIKVMLIDRQCFPRRKACGEGLSSRGVRRLESLKLLSVLTNLPHAKLNGYRIVNGPRQFDIGGPESVIGVRRYLFDEALLRTALKMSDVQFRDDETVMGVEQEGELFRVVGRKESLVTSHVVIAGGENSSLVARKPRFRLSPFAKRLGLSSTWKITSGKPDPVVSTYLLCGGEVFLTPVGDEMVNVSILGSQKFITSFSDKKKLNSLVTDIAQKAGYRIESHSSWAGAGPVNGGFRAAMVGRSFVVGDACESFDPVGGMGMTHALISGDLAARSIKSVVLGGNNPVAAMQSYVRAREQIARELRGFTRLTRLCLTTLPGRPIFGIIAKTGMPEWFANAVHGGIPNSYGTRALSFCGR